MAPLSAPSSPALSIELERHSEVPISTQLVWALRARILSGVLPAGDPLPTLRELADEAGVNLNTIRAAYARLEADGLVETRHGVGTFVAEATPTGKELAQLVASTARAAAGAGIEIRDLAVALYTYEGRSQRTEDPARRRALRDQIAVLEQALAELQARRPDLVEGLAASRGAPRPRLLKVSELEKQRDALLARLSEAQTALAEATSARRAKPKPPAPRTAPSPAKGSRRAPKLRVASSEA